MPRPKITEITVTVELPNGKLQTILVKPDTMALFFDDKAVETILGGFYDNEPGHMMKRFEFITRFGQKITDEVLGPPDPLSPDPANDEIQLTKAIISQVWNAVDEFGLELPMICKVPPCIIG